MERAKRTGLVLEIEAQTPLAIGERKPMGRSAQALLFIPGGLIRGALANLILQLSDEPSGEIHHLCPGKDGAPADCDFCALFLREETAAIFGNAYPSKKSFDGPHLLPATAHSCKDEGGFLGSVKGGKPCHGVFDTLIDGLCSEELRVVIPYHPRCHYCGGRVEAYSGFYSKAVGEESATVFLKESVPQRLLTRVAINRRRLTVEDQLLYSISVLSEAVKARPSPRFISSEAKDSKLPSRFVARVDLPAPLVAEARELFSRVSHLGGGLSRGLGRVKIDAAEEVSDTHDSIERRVKKFNDVLKKRWSLFKRLPCETPLAIDAPDEWSYFTIDLQSDAILFDRDGWRRTMVLSEEILRREGGISEHVELVRSHANYTYRSGWNGAQGYFKDVDVATAMGSVFVYRA
ncbi:MAG TPA: CRISPR-associated RAMP protein Csx10, partial [Blastocatellia bacterium]|nr:CRISPR-associated RAMP protein Csx10 [Blastocatellia bacterium]